MRAVFDPNVLVSAVISPSGAPRELLHRWAGGAFALVVSPGILFELQEVLARPKFRRYLTLAQAGDYVLWLHEGAEEISGELHPDAVRGVTADPDDDYIAGVAYLGRADVVVSGDPHLTDLKAIRDGEGRVIALVLPPRAFLDQLDPGA